MINATVKVDLNGVAPKVDKLTRIMQGKLDEQVLKDSNYFIPRDSGNLEDSGRLSSRPGEIMWDTPYARKLYWNPQYNFSKDSNPNARGKWFEEAKSVYLNEWIKLIGRL